MNETVTLPNNTGSGQTIYIKNNGPNPIEVTQGSKQFLTLEPGEETIYQMTKKNVFKRAWTWLLNLLTE
jgi:hypothetical protein